MSSSLITDGVAHAVLRDANNVVVANVRFGTHTVGSRIQVTGVGLTTGIHGFHVHANNDPSNGDGCVGPTFVSADGHYNPSGGVHPNHAGDMPVLFFSTAQAAFAGSPTFGYNDFISSNFTPEEVKGKAIIIHALPDNCANIPTRYTPQPPDATTLGTGDAGGRVACGVITD
jgi:Cu-Zn family superoxide dismutase